MSVETLVHESSAEGPTRPARRESADSVLAKNLAAAREAAGITQQQLADAAGISRATIAQLETGISDPRLSTVVDLAGALRISPLLLLIAETEVRSLAGLIDEAIGKSVPIRPYDLEQLKRLVGSGLLKDRLRAVRLGAAIAREAGRDAETAIVAGILSAIAPGEGTVLGVAIGDKLSRC